MIPDAKAPEIIQGLLRKTRQGRVEWRQVKNSVCQFSVKLPHSAIFLNYETPQAAPDYVELRLCRPDNTPAAVWLINEGDELWPPAFELFMQVQKGVTGWDKVLEDVENLIAED